MNIKQGYKQTEIGIIPEDWEVKLVQEISDVKSGKRLPLGKSLLDDETPHPYIRVTDMYAGGISLDEIKYVPKDVFPAIRNYRIYQDDIFISVAGTLGIVGKIPKELNGANLTENADRLTNIVIDRDFLLCVLSSPLIQKTIESEKTLGAQPKLALIRIRNFQIPIPPLKEQTAIATALSDIDALIGELDKLIAKKQGIKQATMQQLLTGKKRLAGFSGEWEVKRFKDIFDRGNSKIHQIKTSDYQDSGDFPIIDQGKDLIVGYSDKKEKSYKCSKDGVIVFGDHTCIIKFINFDFVVGADGTQILTIKNGHCTRFHAFQLEYSGIQTTGYNRHFKFLKERLFLAPAIEEQTAIANILSDMDAEIRQLEGRRAKMGELKQGMMQELLTGRIRLNTQESRRC